MSRLSSFDKSKFLIENYFNKHTQKSFSEYSLQEILNRNRYEWGISESKSVKNFISYLQKNSHLKGHGFLSPNGSKKTIYNWKTTDEYTTVSALKSKSYFTHYSAMYLHQLTLQIPKTFYLNFEHSKKFDSTGLSQKAIDSAFSKEQRKSKVNYIFKSRKVILINGKNTGRLGVIHRLSNTESFYYTDLERTLIDCAIRPAYSGGIFEVLQAFKNAIDLVNPGKLNKYLERMDFIYPYNQVIGFYLQKAGYGKPVYDMFKKEKMNYDFYLTYNIKSREYSSEWKLFYPKGI